MLLMFFVITAGSGLAALQITQSKDVWTNVQAIQCFYIAEAGVQDLLARWPSPPPSLSGELKKLDAPNEVFGHYEVSYTEEGATESVVISTGRLEEGDLACRLQAKVDKTGYVFEWTQLPP